MKNNQWILKSRPVGDFKLSDFERQQVDIPDLREGQVLIKTLVLSFDPTQRGWAAVDSYMPAVALNDVMRAFGIGQVISSKHKKFKKGDLVSGMLGWQEYACIDMGEQQPKRVFVLPPYIDIQLSLALMLTGLTAYFGLKEIGKPKAGDTVLVSGAAGATGSIVGQIAKIWGARVVGIAGGPQKCQWLKDVAHFDGVIDYKNDDVHKRIGELCPQGIDVYFDNVGGELLDIALLHLAQKARVVVCGQISQYNKINPQESQVATTNAYGVKGIGRLIINRAKMEGFLVSEYMNNSIEALLCLNQWVEDGKIVQHIDLNEGFENIPETLIGIFQGKNLGKQLLKLSDPPLPLNKSFFGKWLFNAFQRYCAWKNNRGS